jgi:hypothetical protein
MLPRHENEMLSMLERVCDQGSAEVSVLTIKRWFDKERITKTVFRTLEQHYALIDDSPLFIGDLGGTYVFIYGKGLTSDDSSFYKPVESWLATW